MTRIFLLVIWSGSMILIQCQSKNSTAKEGVTDSLKVNFNYTVNDFINSVVNPYIDSIKVFKKGDSIPKFFFDPYLDVNSKLNDWPSYPPMSLREEIFNRIENRVLLDTLISNPIFKIPPKDQRHIKEIARNDYVSTFEMAKTRLQELTTH